MEVIRDEWRPLGDVFYRKRKLYSMKWDVNLARCTRVSAPFGGPIGKLITIQKER